MIRSSLANFVLSKCNLDALRSVVTKNALTNIPYKFFSQRLIDLEFPVHLFIEPTNACNLKCEMCPRTTSSQKIGSMNFELFQRIVDESTLHGRRSFSLHLFGEPLIASNIIKMLRYIREKNIRNVILLTTNGVFLDRKKREAILNFRVDKTTVSLLASTPETYISITGRNNYEVVVDNIMELIRLKKNMGASKPIIYVRVIKNKKTLNDIEAFQRKWSSHDVIVEIREEHNYAGNINSTMDNTSIQRYPCYHPWFAPAIHWDGDMSICCCDWNRTGVIGNVKESTIAEIWQTEKIKEIRKIHLAGNYSQIELCRDCNVYQTYPDVFFEWQKLGIRR